MTGIAPPAVTLAEAQAFARIESGEEEALLDGLVRSSTALCEAFIGRQLIARPFVEIVAASAEWQRLDHFPVRSIETVERLMPDGSRGPIPQGQYDGDIDSDGAGWVRTSGCVDWRVRVSGEAGLAEDPNGVPEPIRQGIVRLAAHLFESRDGPAGEPPAAVTALWRPYRRMRLA
jgi:uncharacterized phiE125 gp8 family phage protein